jgi:putative oxidoreductase
VTLKEISFIKQIKMKYNKPKTWNIILLIVRIWLGYRMMAAGYSSVIGILTSQEERNFFEKWFGTELHFPMPVLMAFLAKGSEVLGGFLVLIGLFTKPAAALIAFTMTVATLTANLGKDWVIDGGFTVSYTVFSLVLIVQGAGKYSLDYLFFKKNNQNLQEAYLAKK